LWNGCLPCQQGTALVAPRVMQTCSHATHHMAAFLAHFLE
jgi:hypothetical protein